MSTVEVTHYLDAKVRKEHVHQLYVLSENIDVLEESLRAKKEEFRKNGNFELCQVAIQMKNHQHTVAQEHVTRAIAAYKKAGDLR